MTIARYENPSCALPGINPDSFTFESHVSANNKQAAKLCAACPDLNTCLKELLEKPREFEGQVRAGHVVTKEFIRELAKTRGSKRVVQTI